LWDARINHLWKGQVRAGYPAHVPSDVRDRSSSGMWLKHLLVHFTAKTSNRIETPHLLADIVVCGAAMHNQQHV